MVFQLSSISVSSPSLKDYYWKYVDGWQLKDYTQQRDKALFH